MTGRPLVVIAAVPRTGSNFLLGVLRRMAGLQVHGEVFHPHSASTLDADHLARIGETTGRVLAPDIRDPDTVAHVRAHPTETIDALRQVAGERVAVFKVFPGHLPDEFVLDELLVAPDVIPVILQRRPLDTYASMRKTKASGRFWGADTTDLTIEGDIDDFERWHRRSRRWYTRIVEALDRADRRPLSLTYEDHLDRPPEAVEPRLRELLVGAGVDPGAPRDAGLMRKQDRTARSSEKFANWASFRDGLAARGLLDAAERYFVDPSP